MTPPGWFAVSKETRNEPTDRVTRQLTQARCVKELVEGLHNGTWSAADLLAETQLAVLGEPASEGEWSAAQRREAGMQPLNSSVLLAYDARMAGFGMPNALPYCHLLADGGTNAKLLMNGMLGVLELHHIKESRLPAAFREEVHLLATDAMVVIMKHGRATVEPTVLHGYGQMPHNLCLAPFSKEEWTERVESFDPEVRIEHMNKFITIQARLSVANECRVWEAMRPPAGHGGDRWMHMLLRAAWRHMLAMFGYYMAARFARLALGTEAVRGLHAFRWWRATQKRMKATAMASEYVVLYSDASPFQSVKWNTAQFDGKLLKGIERQLHVTDMRGSYWNNREEMLTIARARGWVVNKAELTAASSRATWLLCELHGEHAMCINDGDGSEWQLQWMQEMALQTVGCGSSLFMRETQRTIPGALPAAIWHHIASLVKEKAITTLKLTATTHVLQGVECIVAKLCRTESSKWPGKLGRLRGAVVLHRLPRENGWSPKVVVVFHKFFPQGQGKALWGADSDGFSMELLARLNPLLGGKWHEWEHLQEWHRQNPRIRKPFTKADLCLAGDVLNAEEGRMMLAGQMLAGLHMLRPHKLRELHELWGEVSSDDEADEHNAGEESSGSGSGWPESSGSAPKHEHMPDLDHGPYEGGCSLICGNDTYDCVHCGLNFCQYCQPHGCVPHTEQSAAGGSEQ